MRSPQLSNRNDPQMAHLITSPSERQTESEWKTWPSLHVFEWVQDLSNQQGVCCPSPHAQALAILIQLQCRICVCPGKSKSGLCEFLVAEYIYALMSFQACMTYFLQRNTKGDIQNNSIFSVFVHMILKSKVTEGNFHRNAIENQFWVPQRALQFLKEPFFVF